MAAENSNKLETSDADRFKTWLSSSEGTSGLNDVYKKSKEESKTIEKIAIVNPAALKVPFTFNI